MVKNLPVMRKIGVRSLDWEIPWRREWQPTPVFLPGESHGQRSLVGYSPWGHKESDTTFTFTFHQYFRKGIGTLRGKLEEVSRKKEPCNMAEPDYTVQHSHAGILDTFPRIMLQLTHYWWGWGGAKTNACGCNRSPIKNVLIDVSSLCGMASLLSPKPLAKTYFK